MRTFTNTWKTSTDGKTPTKRSPSKLSRADRVESSNNSSICSISRSKSVRRRKTKVTPRSKRLSF